MNRIGLLPLGGVTMNSDILLILEAIYEVLTMEENTEIVAA